MHVAEYEWIVGGESVKARGNGTKGYFGPVGWWVTIDQNSIFGIESKNGNFF